MLSLFLPIKYTIIPILLFLPMITKSEGKMIYDFDVDSSFRNWAIVDDGVMGGLSAGNLVSKGWERSLLWICISR